MNTIIFKNRKLILAFIVVCITIILPWVCGFIKLEYLYPEDFFNYPPLKPNNAYVTQQPFELELLKYFYVIFVVFSTLILQFIFFPGMYRFKPLNSPNTIFNIKGRFPYWFYLGIFLNLFSWFALSSQKNIFATFNEWAYWPLWAGFIMMVDGLTFKISGGKSLIVNCKKQFVFIFLSSISCWLIFDYYNIFVNSWYYPKGDLIKKHQFWLYAIIGSGAFSLMAFEVYYLLKQSPFLTNRYQSTFKITIKNSNLIILNFILTIVFCLGFFYPYSMFWTIWICPIFIILITLHLLKYKTPLTNMIEKGDWSFSILFSVSFLISALFLELWNWSSNINILNFLKTQNPAFWRYNIPHLNTNTKIFEMPVWGYIGYLPFSLNCWIWYKCFVEIFIIGNISFKEFDEYL